MSNTSGMTNSTESPGSTTAKANIVITEDVLIILIDPAEDTRITSAFMAIAQDDAIRLSEPLSHSDFIDLTISEDTDEDTLLNAS